MMMTNTDKTFRMICHEKILLLTSLEEVLKDTDQGY